MRLRHLVLSLALSAGLACGSRSELELVSEEAERCNGVDDDFDGEIDEGIASLSCGEGQCAATAPGCIDGEPGICVPKPPGVEACNGLDDDCDGVVDEGLGFGQIAGPHFVADDGFYAYGLIATETGALTSWAHSFDGQNPVPNGFARPLDIDGAPAGPTSQLIESPVSLGVGPSLARAASGYAVAMCRRFGFEDYPSWMFVDALGNPAAPEHPVAETGEPCTTHDTPPQFLWTGERHLFTWITSSTIGGVHVESTDASGGSPLITMVTEGDLSAPPRLAQHGDLVALVVGERPEPQVSALGVYFTDRQGTSFEKAGSLPDPGGTGYLQPRIAFDASGVLLVLATNRFDPGWFRARIGPDGTILSGPTVELDDLEIRDLARREAGGFWATAMDPNVGVSLLLELDEEGAVVMSYPVPEPAYNPILTPRAGRVHVVYTAWAAATPNAVHSVVYGCQP